MQFARPQAVKPVKLTLPWLHPKQNEFVQDQHRFVIAACGSKTGKTFGLANWAIKEAWNRDQALVWWVAPVYKQAQIAFKLIGRLLPPSRYHKRSSAGEMSYELLYSDGRVRSIIDFRSAENPDTLRGEGVHAAVGDEAGFWKKESFVSLMTTLTQTAGKLRLISTPKGKNWFYEEWCKGWFPEQRLKNPDHWSYKLPTTVNPFIKPEAIEALRKAFTENQFRQEVLAEFLDDGAGVFHNIKGCQKARLLDRPRPGRRYIVGIDWARDQDYTVLLVMDAELKRVVHVERFHDLDWNINIDRAVRCAKEWNRASIIMDSWGVGSVPLDMVKAVYPFVEGYNTYNSEPKVALIQRLQLALERNEIEIPIVDGYTNDEDPDTKKREVGEQIEHELSFYNATITKTGRWQYSAPEGYNDDLVIALALATLKAVEEPLIYRYDLVRGV